MQSHNLFWTLVIGMVQVLLPFALSCEVNGCFCYEEYLSCHNLTSFPAQFPKELEDLYFHDVTFDKIPTDAFRGLKNMKTFKIYRGSVGTIERSSFNGFKRLQTVFFDNVSIGEIQGHAFGSLRNISLTFQSSSIPVIRSYAFENIRNAHAFVFANLNIGHIESRAFENISDIEMISFRMCNITSMAPRCFHNFNRIRSFGFHTNEIEDLSCGNIDSAISAVTDRLQVFFFSNILSCNCDLAWIVNNPIMTIVLPYSNRCILPGTRGHVKVGLADLTLGVLNCTQQDTICPDNELTATTTEVTTQATHAPTSSMMTDFVTGTLDMTFSTSELPVSSDNSVNKSDFVTTSAVSVTTEPESTTPNFTITSILTKTTKAPSVSTGSTTSSQNGNEQSSVSHHDTMIETVTSTLPGTSSHHTISSSETTETTVTRSVSGTLAMSQHTTSSTKAGHGEASGATYITWSVMTLTFNSLLCIFVKRIAN
ncbi:leucine-rich repeat-containing G-protein coupled receptor 5-like [Pecten maximus]|uniref:leucine-rich repeat-containing G-protein coupled receptor 5-like n=1 Tax=Pecten maximus TaxID=6579 RepID=UPI00145888F4|nr:leucine-rich repeat-containing G-protein coupled receptor 5-like [Pecten maximus]